MDMVTFCGEKESKTAYGSSYTTTAAAVAVAVAMGLFLVYFEQVY